MDEIKSIIENGFALTNATFTDYDTLTLTFEDGSVVTASSFFDPDEDRSKLSIEVD